jgi:hypothetical protein
VTVCFSVNCSAFATEMQYVECNVDIKLLQINKLGYEIIESHGGMSFISWIGRLLITFKKYLGARCSVVG